MRLLLITIFVISFFGTAFLPFTFSVTGEGGTVFIEKAVYEVNRTENVLVKIFGIVENPLGGNWVFFTITNPDGSVSEVKTTKTSEGHYENFIIVNNDRLGKHSVDVRFELKNIGTVTFEVVDKYAKMDEQESEPGPESKLESNNETKPPADFVDPNLEPSYYVARYVLEPSYKNWFDSNYSEYLIWEAVGITESEYMILVDEIYGGPQTVIPNWIKNNAGWWADGLIDDSTFLKGIEYLVNEKIIIIPPTEEPDEYVTDQTIPAWVKNNAGWWADGIIDDSTFVSGIEYLVKSGIIVVS